MRLSTLAENSQNLVDNTEKSQEKVEKIICQAYKVIYGTCPVQKECAELPYGLKVYQNPKITIDLSLITNPSEYNSCSELEVLATSSDNELLKNVLKLFLQTAQIPFRFERFALIETTGSDLRRYNSVRQLIDKYEPEFVRDIVYRRLVGKKLRWKEDKVLLDELKKNKKRKR